MTHKIVLIMCSLLLLPVIGCQEEQKAPQETLSQEVKDQLIATCDGCDTRMTFMVSPEDIITARNPSGNQELFLTVVGTDGRPKECCQQPMRVMVDKDGRLSLKCPKCGKIKPVAVKDGKVIVE